MLHIAAYARPDGADPAQGRRVEDLFKALAEAVDGARLLAVGANSSRSALARGWDFAAVVAFGDDQVRAAFLGHALHDELGRETSDGFYDSCIVLDVPVHDNQGDRP